MIKTSEASIEPLVKVAQAFGFMLSDVVFLGGAVLPLLITDPAAGPARPTEDVDVVVEAQSRTSFYEFEEKIRSLGFRNDQSENAPICRWVVNGIKVDIMPVDSNIFGFSNPWYTKVFESSSVIQIAKSLNIHLISPVLFLAVKYAAFIDPARGKWDYMASRDLEDIISLIDGRPELDQEIQNAGLELKAYLADAFKQLLKEPDFIEALPGHLPGDPAGQARLPRIKAFLQKWAG